MADSHPKRKKREASYILTPLCTFILELVAVFFGVLGAFELDNWRDRKAEDKERGRVLGLISHELESNQAIVNAMNLTPPSDVVNARPMRNIWEGIASKLSVLNDDTLLIEVTLAYFDLANLGRDIDMYEEYARKYQYATKEQQATMRPVLESQCNHFKGYATKTVLPQIAKVVKLIHTQLDHKEPSDVPKSNEKGRVP